MPKCNRPDCGFEGQPSTFKGSPSLYHDFVCPKCGTTDIDTTDVYEAWLDWGKTYSYGKGNTLDTSEEKT